jgi:hypothetical protein
MPRFTVKAMLFYMTLAATYLAAVGLSMRDDVGFAPVVTMLIFTGALFYWHGYVQHRKK